MAGHVMSNDLNTELMNYNTSYIHLKEVLAFNKMVLSGGQFQIQYTEYYLGQHIGSLYQTYFITNFPFLTTFLLKE